MIFVHGPLDQAHAADVWAELERSLPDVRGERVRVDLSDVTEVDGAGAALLAALERRCVREDRPLVTHGVPESLDSLRVRDPGPAGAQPAAERPGLVDAAGHWTLARVRRARSLLEFLGLVLIAAARTATGRRRTAPLDHWLHQVQRAGAEAMTLAVSLSFLMGLITAINFIRGLADFNATGFLPGVVAVSLTRELAPLLTGIVLAGRSGAGLAAELGTMKAGEEIDALEAMGFDVTSWLILPRIAALLAAGPLLTALGDAVGLAGGALIGWTNLEMSPSRFLADARDSLRTTDVGIGLVKGFAFAVVVGVVGCHRGLSTGRASESVGVQTTSAVVLSILLILVVDAALTAGLQVHGW